MNTDPLKVIADNDSALLESVNASRELAFSEGAIPVKYKLLIAMALDAAHGAANGVQVLAQQAMQAGATKDEIMEAVRVAGFVSGAGSVYAAAYGLNEVFEK